MNPDNQNPVNQTPTTPQASSVQVNNPIPPKSNGPRKMIVILIILIVVILAGVGTFVLIGKMKTAEITKITPAPIIKISPTVTPDPTADWKTYTDPNNVFSFKYPSDLAVNINENKINSSDFLTGANIKYEPPVGVTLKGNIQMFYLGIEIWKDTTRITNEQVKKELFNRPTPPPRSYGERITNISDYKNGDINGVYYESVGDQAESRIYGAINDKNFVFSFNSQGSITGSETRALIDQILSTFKFINEKPAVIPSPIQYSALSQNLSNTEVNIFKDPILKLSFNYPKKYFLMSVIADNTHPTASLFFLKNRDQEEEKYIDNEIKCISANRKLPSGVCSEGTISDADLTITEVDKAQESFDKESYSPKCYKEKIGESKIIYSCAGFISAGPPFGNIYSLYIISEKTKRISIRTYHPAVISDLITTIVNSVKDF